MNTKEILEIYSGNKYSKRLLKQWDEYATLVSKAYIEAPSFDGKVTQAWQAMIPWIDNMYNKIFTEHPEEDKNKKKVKVEFGEEDAYQNAEQMQKDLKENNRLKVYTGGEPHPIWDQETNSKFRAIHDKMAHYDRPSDFTMSGEIKAYNAHIKTCPKISIPALFTEVIGQAAVFYNTGSFMEQKIAFLPGFDYVNLGVVEGYDIKDKQMVKKESYYKPYYKKALSGEIPMGTSDVKQTPQQPVDKNQVDQTAKKLLEEATQNSKVAPGQEMDFLNLLQQSITQGTQDMLKKTQENFKKMNLT